MKVVCFLSRLLCPLQLLFWDGKLWLKIHAKHHSLKSYVCVKCEKDDCFAKSMSFNRGCCVTKTMSLPRKTKNAQMKSLFWKQSRKNHVVL